MGTNKEINKSSFIVRYDDDKDKRPIILDHILIMVLMYLK